MLSAAGKKRLRIWQAGMGTLVDVEEEQAMLNSLENTDRLGWLQGAHQAERKALLSFLQGKVAARQGEVQKAMQAFERVFPVAQSDDTLKPYWQMRMKTWGVNWAGKVMEVTLCLPKMQKSASSRQLNWNEYQQYFSKFRRRPG